MAARASSIVSRVRTSGDAKQAPAGRETFSPTRGALLSLPASVKVAALPSRSPTMSDASRLRILVIGASGELGRAVIAELGARHDIVTAGSKSGDIRIDIADAASILAGLKAA